MKLILIYTYFVYNITIITLIHLILKTYLVTCKLYASFITFVTYDPKQFQNETPTGFIQRITMALKLQSKHARENTELFSSSV